MQFIPSTWAIVGVDADNDGQRNPQDIYDAALASAVYLCSGSDDLSTIAGQRSAVFRYNHSQRYVDLVLAIERAYLAGDYSAVPNGTTTTGFTLRTPLISNPVHHTHHMRHQGHQHHGHHSPTTTTDQPTSGTTAGPTAGPTSGTTADPTQVPTSDSTKLPTILPTTIVPTVVPTILTTTEAIAQCLAEGLVDNPLDPNDAFDRCVYDLTH